MSYEAVDNQVELEIRDKMFLGAVVLAGNPDGFLFYKAYGQRDVGKPMELDSIFDVASVTKPVTAGTSLAVVLERHQEMSINDPMIKFLPYMAGKGSDRMTIKNVAGHRSGLDNTKEYLSDPYNLKGEKLIEAVLKRDVSHEVDSKFEYSCLGMIRLGEMVASVSKMDFGKFCEQNIFSPLEMADTRFGPVAGPDKERCVRMRLDTGQIDDNNARLIGRPVGNAGMFTTAADLSHIALLWLNKGEYKKTRLFSSKVYETIIENKIVWLYDKDGIPAGLSDRTFWHTGYTGQSLWIDPESKTYIIVLTNWSHPNTIETEREKSRAARIRIAAKLIEQLHNPLSLKQ